MLALLPLTGAPDLSWQEPSAFHLRHELVLWECLLDTDHWAQCWQSLVGLSPFLLLPSGFLSPLLVVRVSTASLAGGLTGIPLWSYICDHFFSSFFGAFVDHLNFGLYRRPVAQIKAMRLLFLDVSASPLEARAGKSYNVISGGHWCAKFPRPVFKGNFLKKPGTKPPTTTQKNTHKIFEPTFQRPRRAR